MARFTLVALLVSACIVPGAARAENIVGSSVEWLTCASEVVVVGRIEKVVATRGPGDVFYDDCSVVVQEVIKGKVRVNRLNFCLRRLSVESAAKRWMKSEEPILLFLSKSPKHGSETHLDNMLIPTTHQFPFSVIELSSPGKYVIDIHFKVLTDKKAIVATCRKAAEQLAEHLKQNPDGKIRLEHVEVPLSSDAWRSLYAGSSCHLKVPVFDTVKQK
jgi:hypothetical protein